MSDKIKQETYKPTTLLHVTIPTQYYLMFDEYCGNADKRAGFIALMETAIRSNETPFGVKIKRKTTSKTILDDG